MNLMSFRRLIVFLLHFLLCTSLLKASSASSPWSSWFSSSDEESTGETTEKIQEEDEKTTTTISVVSPLINRELRGSVVAQSWPSNPYNIYCEAWAYHSDESRDFLKALASLILEKHASFGSSYEQAVALALQASPLDDKKLLEYALSLRAHSPQCELHRGLARQMILNIQKVQPTFEVPPRCNALAVIISSDGYQLALEDDIPTLDWNDYSCNGGFSTSVVDEWLLPGEEPLGMDQGECFVILYANMGSLGFAKAFSRLMIDDDKIQFVIRHLGAVDFEETGPRGNTKSLVLQGYGVRLDIRNVEYKVFDDRVDLKHADDGKTSLVDLKEPLVSPFPPQFLAGVNVSSLEWEDEASRENAVKELWKTHQIQLDQSQMIPPNWQRRKISLQAALVISSSKDPLMTLQEVSQNLPTVSSTLVQQAKIPQSLETVAESIKEELRGVVPSSGLLLVNGRRVYIDRSTFNVFEFVNTLKKEQVALRRLESEVGHYFDGNRVALQKLQEAWSMGDAFWEETSDSDDDFEDESTSSVFRIDVGRGWKKAIMYLNDIETDPAYANWSPSVSNAMMAMQFGAPPMVRRNLFTMLAVIDPIESTHNIILDLARQLMQSSFPARLGVVLVAKEDVAACADFLLDNKEATTCPANEETLKSDVKREDLDSIPATTQAIHHLVSHVMSTYQRELAHPYVDYYLQTLDQTIMSNGEDQLSMFDLLSVHASLMASFRFATEDAAFSSAMEALSVNASDDDDHSYGKALWFAATKGLQPGMSFFNGRPLPQGERQDIMQTVSTIFREEQDYVFQLISMGEINDSGPRSVYSYILKTGKVFKKVHPLLMESSGGSDAEKYRRISSNAFGPSSLVLVNSPSIDDAPTFVLEAYLNLNSLVGVNLAKSLISIMDVFPFEPENEDSTHVKLAYRIVPSGTFGKGGVCAIFSHAGDIGSSTVASVLDRLAASVSSDDANELTLDTLLDGLEISDEAREKILSTAESCDGAPHEKDNILINNGRVFKLSDGSLSMDDVDLLLSLDSQLAKAAVLSFGPFFKSAEPNLYCHVMGQITSFLAVENDMSQTTRIAVEQDIKALGEGNNPLVFSFNEEEDDHKLKVKVTAIVDPTSEMAQRVSPLLLVLRDTLQLPLTLVLFPRLKVDSDSNAPITSYYRFVASPLGQAFESSPGAHFEYLPTDHVLTLRMDVPEPWDIQQSNVIQDTDNLRCDLQLGCSDDDHIGKQDEDVPIHLRKHVTNVEYGLNSLLVFGQCYETSGASPNGLQLTLKKHEGDEFTRKSKTVLHEMDVQPDGSLESLELPEDSAHAVSIHSDTLVMKNVGYWQLRANPGVWDLAIAEDSSVTEVFDMVDGVIRGGKVRVTGTLRSNVTKTLVLKDFVNQREQLILKRRPGFEKAKLFSPSKSSSSGNTDDDVINVFSLATGHLYERFLKIMMLSVTRRTSSKVKFWLFENFLSPSFKASARYMAKQIGCEVEFVTYKWPEWLRGQREKQRIIWGYKILFLDVLFPLGVKKIIYVDADQVIRGDLKELWDMDLEGAPYGYTPMCSSRESTLGFQFWRGGFWERHLRGKPYHISALYVVDLEKFRETLVGDILRSVYQQLSADPNSLANLDQDLPNYAQHDVPIFSLPQEWLWCESWCSDETKPDSKTIDLCNNPLHKEPKVSMAKRIISGPLFNESWVELDAEVDQYQQEYLSGMKE